VFREEIQDRGRQLVILLTAEERLRPPSSFSWRTSLAGFTVILLLKMPCLWQRDRNALHRL
jgi:hypothetical protein